MAKHQLWRCQNEDCSEDLHGRLIYDFQSDEPVCPKCGADQRKVEGRNTVVKREVVHYLVINSDGPIVTPNGRRMIACNPAEKKLPANCTASIEAVSCPDCLAATVLLHHQDDELVQDAKIVKPQLG